MLRLGCNVPEVPPPNFPILNDIELTVPILDFADFQVEDPVEFLEHAADLRELLSLL